MKINGKWYFNEVVSDTNEKAYVSFVSNGKDYIGLAFSITAKDVARYYYQDTKYDMAWDSGVWINEAYRTIDFGAAYQEVSDEFYSWLTANAVQLSKPIPMTHPKGIKLLTKGHKLSKDLEVVPTFMETVKVTLFSSDSSTGTVYYTVVENGQYTLKSVSVNDTETIIHPIKNSIILFNGDGFDFQADSEGLTKIVSFNGYYNENTDDAFDTLYAFQATANGSLTLYVG